MIDRSPRTLAVRALLALTIAYVLLLQGLFASAAASAHLASASAGPGMMQALCSGAQDAGEPRPVASDHHGAAQSSCCSWGTALALDPIAPPGDLAAAIPYAVPTASLVAFPPLVPLALLFRTATGQGSRAPPILAA